MQDQNSRLDPRLVDAYGGTIEAALQLEMRAGERILWKSRQHPKLFGSGSIAAWLFAIPWTAFALFWTGMAWSITRSGDGPQDSMSYLFPFFGIPFILIGLGMFGRPVLRNIAAKYTILAITNQRVIRFLKRKNILVQSVPPHRIGQITVLRGKEHGTVSFKLKGKAGDYEPKGARFVLYEVEDVGQAEDLIRDLKRSATD